MGLLNWIKKRTLDDDSPLVEAPVLGQQKTFEGVSFPAEVSVTIEPKARWGELTYRWFYHFDGRLQEGTEDTRKVALKEAAKDAWFRVNRKRKADKHLAQGKIKI